MPLLVLKQCRSPNPAALLEYKQWHGQVFGKKGPTMRVDAHHHFWQLDRYQYGWIGPDKPALQHNFGPHELKPSLDRHRIDQSVLVQTMSSLDETRWFLELAEQHLFLGGVVGWVDLTSPDVGRTLDELKKSPRLVGIRHVVHDEPDERWLVRDDVQRGLKELAKRRVPYDLLIRPRHLDAAYEVAKNFPALPLVVDHIAKPEIAAKKWDDWAPDLGRLAACPNVFCKLSGMITEARWHSWTPEDLRTYILHAIDCFGPERCMFGSDWPVSLLAGTYDRVIEALEVNIRHLSEAERAAIMGGTAERFYGLQTRQ